MTWGYWICLYLERHCTARGLRPRTIAAYKAALEQFRGYVQERCGDKSPAAITACDVLEYAEYVRTERRNRQAALNRHVTILTCFYRAMVAMGHLEPARNPMAHFPKMKPPARKLPRVLAAEEVTKLLSVPRDDTVLGLRDRAMLALLYGTGIRASECAGLTMADVDLQEKTVRVQGKGGHERAVPLNASVVAALAAYRLVRGEGARDASFFLSRSRKALSRNAVYERVRTNGCRARIEKRVTPHKLRHTFATHLVRAGVGIVTIRDLLGHRLITSTQIYLHVTAQEMRAAADRHPIKDLAPAVTALLPDVKLPFQRSARWEGGARAT